MIERVREAPHVYATDHGADVNARSHFVPAANGRGFEGRTPVAPQSGQAAEEFASG